ncbi:uncharacterized protein LOC120672386 isoform X1 [Panicum virgatum]|uniref:uncharacterized protein LOC120672386 isoform X1 n=1 Tax=Panicum virgatum TaxID=38727 RepID=UPI0019D55D4F|nr:uncharacterized protein LOC120672386 isoform X1 [Panicum virgatum]XP_039808686.1 uncharacterized protein LOC120672386 isoform X1 [Panicum virgatum]XP_039808687.1 uncharacterized protein LOC120672386 isoform X1 [Panicum virgatum]XP_039808688.1 uncharacterized protein LOC120672386 isoform X1 [Panicum virgatum]XP_039808689.1 uncharacterized protein LOC120672386 isoform X1 [Panicum virgatum]XP_039808690.1 uncharacterized protein LOC120672386 isoform X1 [Panicum virgatum]XP_039808691.1 uncharac
MRADRAMGERGGEQRRIDLGAPLRSARRGDAPPRCKPDLKSGPVRHPGAVPFVWEQRPGQPKSVRTRRAAPPTPPREAGGGGGSPYHDALADLDLQALHGAADRGSRAAPASREVVAIEATKEARKQEAVSVAAVLRKPHGDGEEEEERFSDALDTLSRTESFAMNCSVSGLSGAPGAGPEARDLMMDRFLPAAQAVAVGSPQYTFRKAGGTSNSCRDHAHARAAAAKASAGSGDDRMRRAPVQLPYQHLPPNYLSCAYPKREEHEEEDEEDDDDYDVHSTRGFSAKGCGLLPGLCVKTSLLLLNPMPAMKRGKALGRGRGRQFPSKGRAQMAQSPLARSLQNKHLGCDSNGQQSWEDVYKYKLEQKYLGQGEDGRSKVTSESNHLTFWSDSQTGDGSSPYHRPIAGGMSSCRNYAMMSPSSKANGSSRIGDRDDKASRSNGSSSLGRDHDRTSLVGSDHSSFKGSSSMSSGPDLAGREDSMDHHGDTDSETCHLGVLVDTRAAPNANMCDSQPGEQQIVGKKSIMKDQVNDPLTEKISEVREPTFPPDDGKDLSRDANQEVPSHLEDNNVARKEIIPLQSLLPLPVPKSPSESWLSRTLPSVTNKPPPPSFLGIQVHSKKQASWATVHPKENDHKPSRPRQIGFADVVEKPISMDSEI